MSNKLLPHGACKQRTLTYWHISGKCGQHCSKVAENQICNTNEQRTTTNARMTAARQYCLAIASAGRVMFVVAELPHCHSPCVPPSCQAGQMPPRPVTHAQLLCHCPRRFFLALCRSRANLINLN